MAEGDVEYTKPNVVLDLERRQAEEQARASGEAPPADENARVFQVEDNDTSAYIGVDPEYQNYADETHKPFAAEEGAEQDAEQRVAEFLASEKQNVTTEEGEQQEQAAPEPAPEPRRRREPAPE